MQLIINIQKKHFYLIVGLISVLSILLITNGAYVGHSWDDIVGGSPILSSLKVTGDVEVAGKLNASNGIKIGNGAGEEGVLRWNDTLERVEINNGTDWKPIEGTGGSGSNNWDHLECYNGDSWKFDGTTPVELDEPCPNDCYTVDGVCSECRYDFSTNHISWENNVGQQTTILRWGGTVVLQLYSQTGLVPEYMDGSIKYYWDDNCGGNTGYQRCNICQIMP
jgi:hypothetical protein